MKNENMTGLVSVIAMIGIIGVAVFGMTKVDQYLKIKALDDCARVSVYTYETKKGVGTGEESLTRGQEMVRKVYELCVQEKGYGSVLTNK